MVDLRQKDGSIDEVEQWAGFLCELIGKFRNISFKSLNLDLNYFNFESFFRFTISYKKYALQTFWRDIYG